eukprot:GHUV01032299.1.p1 GENE.GHUV01032299.1~~GHUV01032299.1.p1  ORF type:complete len:201 (+),score=57.52 GHUV01032299.1:545-1147(+)
MQLPNAWNPVAWLAVYCAVVKRDSRQDSKLVAASFKAADSGAAVGSGWNGSVCLKDGTMSTLEGYAALGAGAAAGARWSGADDLDADDGEEEEGWGFVQAPFLPPPPSQPDEVEHWARAMFTDGNALARAGSTSNAPQQGYGLGLGIGLPRGLGAAAAAAGQGPGLLGPGRMNSGGVVLGSSPSYGGMVPMERIRSLFSR